MKLKSQSRLRFVRAFCLAAALLAGFASVAEEVGRIPDIGRPRNLWTVEVDGECEDSKVTANLLIVSLRISKPPYQRLEARKVEDGALVWKSETGGVLGAIAGGNVIVSSRKDVVAIDSTSGKEKWRFSIKEGGWLASPAVLDGDCLYVAEYRPSPKKKDAVGPSTFFCLEAKSGRELWNVVLPTGVIRAAPVFDDDFICVVREYGVSCISKKAKKEVWSKEHANTVRSSAIPYKNSFVIPVHGLVCFSASDGTELWKVKGGPADYGAVIKDQILYTQFLKLPHDYPYGSSFVPSFAAIDPSSGKAVWERNFSADVRGSCLVTANNVYLTCWDDNLYCLDRKTGAVKWKFPIELKQWAPAVQAANGRLFLCFQNKIVCIGEDKK